MIKASLLDRRVLATHYPEGHFGEWIHEGVLVTNRIKIADQTRMGLVFSLLAEAIDGSDYLSEEVWLESGQPDISVGDYRRSSGFVPDLVVDMAGDSSVRVEIDLIQERILVQSGADWESYVMDRLSAAALKELLAGLARSGD